MYADTIRQLASRTESRSPFLSLYLDTSRDSESHHDRIRLLLKEEIRDIRDALGSNGHRAQIEHGIHQIEQYVGESLAPSTRGVAIFSGPEDQFFLPIELPVSVSPRLFISGRPHLRPLVELRQQFPLTMLAMVDGKSARVFELEFGQILHEIDLDNPDMPRHHEQGGWSQANLQRHVQDRIDRHQKEVAELLTRMMDRNKTCGTIISGQERNLANFRSFLPKRVEDRIIGELHLDIRSAASEIVKGCQEIIEKSTSEGAIVRLEELQETASKNGRAALGIDAVIDAANQRKLEHVFIEHGTQSPGWKCSSCSLLAPTVTLGCVVCGSAMITVDLVEELIARCETEQALFDLVGPSPVLEPHEGFGAFLRF